MDLNEIRKRAKYNKVIVIMICVMLVFSIVTTSYIQADAFAPAVFLVPAAIVLAILVTCGLANEMTMSDLGDLAAELYDNMTGEIKDIIDRHQEASIVAQLFGMAAVEFTIEEWITIKTWFNLNFASQTGTVNIGAVAPENIDDYKFLGTPVFNSNVNTAYTNSAENKIKVLWTTAGQQYQVAYKAYVGADLEIKFNADNTVNISSSTLQATRYYCNSTDGPLQTTYNFGTTGEAYKLIEFIGTFQIVNDLGAVIGTLDSGNGITYNRDMLFDPNDYPIPSDSVSGDVTINVPIGELGEDTNIVPVPESSISAPLTLQNIIDAYGSIDGFFDAGNAITLADGTVIGKLAEYGRAQDIPVGSTTVETGVTDIGVIKEVTRAIGRTLTTIATTVGTGIETIISKLSNPFDWNDKPGGPGVINGIGGFFAVLLALLIAIMHLIAKVIAFIGQLYLIPASDAMLHPTMVQGIEWARGFHTAGGVNLYSLITGVISIVLGIVCFKLLRKLITGIGTASFVEERETLPMGSHRTGGW